MKKEEVTYDNLYKQSVHTIYQFVMDLDGGIARLDELLHFNAITKEQYDLVRKEAAILDYVQN